MSSHMKPNRSWPGVPKRYMTSSSSTVMRPKSIATVVVLSWTFDVSSMPTDSVVIAASVVSGVISETEPTNVVLPTPKPPATTNFTEVMRRTGALEASYTIDHPRQHGQLNVNRIVVVDDQPVLGNQITDEHARNPERELELGRHLGDRVRGSTQLQDASGFEGSLPRIGTRLHQRLDAQRIGRARTSAGHHKRTYEITHDYFPASARPSPLTRARTPSARPRGPVSAPSRPARRADRSGSRRSRCRSRGSPGHRGRCRPKRTTRTGNRPGGR